MKRRRPLTTLSLSFLDAICCGFGAVLLLFLILSHNSVAQRREATDALQQEVAALEQQVLSGREQTAALGADLDQASARRQRLLAQARTATESIAGRSYDLAQLETDRIAREAHVNRLKADLKSRDEELKRLEGGAAQRAEEGDRLRAFPGRGDRQYLTGLKVGGQRILILLDTSASMLAERIVDIVRLRNLPAAEQRQAAKSLYLRLGSKNGIKELSTRLYAAHVSNKQIGHMFEHVAREPFIEHVTDFLVAHSGGEGTYQGRSMAQVHDQLGISYSDFLSAGGDVQTVMKGLGHGDEEIQEAVCFLVSFVPQVVKS